ncbi:MAG: hypothetical protein EXS48_00410 [Candidatus Staskawiczbacteria bacterium]|nr:hypothetical protein [Candidatus Staskawiczbacteria bacterium]
MEASFLEQFGIDWKLFLSQLINFVVILIVLRFFVYKPVLKIIKERNKKIQEGLDKAKEAGIRLHEVDQIAKEKIREANNEAISIMNATQLKAKELENSLQQKIEQSHLRSQKELEENYKKQQTQAQEVVFKNAVDLVKKTIIKTVQLKPADIDDSLIVKAIESIKNEK